MNYLKLSALLVFITIASESYEIQLETRKCPDNCVYPVNIITNRQIKFNMFTQKVENQISSNLDTMNQRSLNQAPSGRMLQNLAHNSNMQSMHRKLERPPTQRNMNLQLNRYTMKSTRSVLVVTTPSDLPTTTVTALECNATLQVPTTEQTIYTPQDSTTDMANTDMSTLKSTWISEQYYQSIDEFEQKFYAVTFNKLRAISPPSRRENGMSYVQSGLFLHLALMTLSTEVDLEIKREIDDILGLQASDEEKIELINATVSSLPTSSEELKFRWSSHLVLKSQTVSQQFLENAAPAQRLTIDSLNANKTAKEVAAALNLMIELDSGGAIHDTFDEEDFSDDVRAVLITTLYMRARWRSAPTLLNGSRPFRDSVNAPHRPVRMIRVNDIMRYADLTELDAEAIEIFYFTPGLSLLMLVPRGTSLRRLADQAADLSLRSVIERMEPLRIAASLPLYTLRMTLLLPNKLEAMNITHLVEASAAAQNESFRLSHAVQRIMFWAEAGRNAFKDDGLEWDEPPQREIVVDRPYIFYVRWKNKTLLNGNFVL